MNSDAHSLAEQLAAIAPEPTTPRDYQAHFIASLTEQFAAGQSEALYSLHTAGATLRRQAEALQAAVERLPSELHPALQEEFARLAAEATTAAVASIEEATAALATRLSQAKSSIDKAFSKHASGLATTVQEALQQISDAVEDAGDELAVQGKALSKNAETFSADAKATADAVTAVGENVIVRLLEVLDVREKNDKALEDRLNARIDRLTKRTEATVDRLISALAAETASLRAQAEAEHATSATQLTELLERLLTQPRGKLKDLRAEATKESKK